jgi:DNA-binding transcriptional LysR family regulator
MVTNNYRGGVAFMNDKQVHAFLTIAECGSFTRASETLFLSKQALMKQINAMESELGFPLIHRSSVGITLTAAGQQFRTDLIEIQRSTRLAIQRGRALSRAKEQLRICCHPFPSTTVCSLLSAFAQAHPEISQEISVLQQTLELDVQFGSGIDFVETNASLRGSTPSDRCLPLFGMPLRCFLLPNHPLACRDQLSPADLCGYAIAVSENELSDELMILLSNADVQPERRGSQPEQLLNWCFQQGVFLASLPEYAFAGCLCSLPFTPTILWARALYYAPVLSPAADVFLRFADDFLAARPVSADEKNI